MNLWDSNLSNQTLSLFLSFFISQISEELEWNCLYPLEKKENVNKGKLKRYHWENTTIIKILRGKIQYMLRGWTLKPTHYTLSQLALGGKCVYINMCVRETEQVYFLCAHVSVRESGWVGVSRYVRVCDCEWVCESRCVRKCVCERMWMSTHAYVRGRVCVWLTQTQCLQRKW